MQFFCPQGIGDSLWALHKIRSIAAAHGAERIDLLLASNSEGEVQRRALPFLARFGFLSSVGLVRRNCVGQPDTTSEGYWNYLPDGPLGDTGYYALMPNAVLERGKRLETWLSDYPIDWGTMGDFRFTQEERQAAAKLRSDLGPYVVFYPGPLEGNTTSGHNRGGLWRPEHWDALALSLRSRGLAVVAVGAEYDRSYFDTFLRPYAPFWRNAIGLWGIGQTLAVCKGAELVVSYQSGIGICSHYLGTPTVMWWRAKGDSACRPGYVSFEEDMAHSWTNPVYRERYLPLIYGRCSVGDIERFYDTRGGP